MRNLLTALLLLLLIFPGSSSAQNFEDEFIEELFEYLAKRRWFNRLPYHGEGVAEIGKLYYLEEPRCPNKLQEWAKKGRESPPLFLYGDGFDFKEDRRFREEETITFGWDRSRKLAAELRGLIKDQGFDLNQFLKDLASARVAVTVVRQLVPWGVVQKYVDANRSALLQAGVPDEASGIIIPFQQLLVVDFTYDQEALKEAQGLLSILQAVSARLTVGKTAYESRSLELPPSSTIAYKPFPIYFRCWR